MTNKKEAKVEGNPPKCGLIAPIAAMDGCSEAHWEEVRFIIKEALQDTDFIVELVSDSNEVGIIQKRIVENIYYNDMIICDVSGKNPNVMFELGMRLAFDKPTIIIKDDKTNYSFDTAPIEHIEYPRDLHYLTIQNFKVKLRSKVIATYEASKKPEYTTFLKHFGQFITTGIESKPVEAEQFIIEALMEMKAELKSLRSERSTTITNIYKENSRLKPNANIPSFVRNHPTLITIDRTSATSQQINELANEITDDYFRSHDLSGISSTVSTAIASAIHSTLVDEIL